MKIFMLVVLLALSSCAEVYCDVKSQGDIDGNFACLMDE